MSQSRPASHKEYETAYQQLNSEQKKAVDTIEGPVMVIAGPGTGKTQILTLRIATILLKTDTPPESILALTFTESGAQAMRERLRRYIGTTAYKVPIYTFHGFAEQLIKQFPDSFTRIIGGRAASDIERLQIIEECITSLGDITLRPLARPDYYVVPVRNCVSELKRENVSPDTLRTLIAGQEDELAAMPKLHEKGAHKGKVRGEYTKLEGRIRKNLALLEVYRRYEAMMREARLYDFDDMILETLRTLESDEHVLRQVQEQFLYVLADEHQDVNGAQNTILKLLTNFHDRPNIFVVGDEKQAIYRFQGASLENFLYFDDVFKDTTTISLTENYRSTQAILDAAHDLVAVEDGPLADLRVALKAATSEQGAVERHSFSHQLFEDEWLVEKVKEQKDAGVSLSEMAIIVRSNKEVSTVASLLRRGGIAATASADGDILNHPITSAVEHLLQAVLDVSDDVALFKVLHAPYIGFTATQVVRIGAARSRNQSLGELLTDKEALEEAGVPMVPKVLAFAEVLQAARDRSVTEAPHRVLEQLLNETGFIAHIMKHDPLEGTRVVRRLYDEIESVVVKDGASTLAQVVEQLAMSRRYTIGLTAPYIATDAESVQVMTAHKSKGLEFNTVFVPYATDRTWGGASHRSLFTLPLVQKETAELLDPLDDERRLLYVAMTRAERALFVSASETNHEGKDLLLSRLCEEIDEELLPLQPSVETGETEAILAPLTRREAAFVVEPELLIATLTKYGFSATSFNNFTDNPWTYFYRNVLRIPETQATHMQFGTAMHATLERVTKHTSATGELPPFARVKEWLEQSLQRLPVSVEEYTSLHEKGMSALAVYMEHYAATKPFQTKEEVKLRVTLPTGVAALPELLLTGSLDRIDCNEAGEALRVIDYKTGKPKSRNYIEGKTKDSNGGYKRQLVFYALLLQLHDDERLQTKEGVLSFVEPTPKGDIKEEVYEVTQAEVDTLREDICGAVETLLACEWLNDTELQSDTEYSELVEGLLSLRP